MKLNQLLCLLLVSPCLAQDHPRPDLWLYSPTNLQVDANVEKLRELWGRAAKAGYTKILLADSKMAKLGDLGGAEERYFANVARVKKLAADLHLEVVPALFHIGYSNSMLWHDPNLAEGLPVKGALFVVHNGEARLEADPPVVLGPKFGFVDETVKIEDGVATVRDHPGNARFSFPLAVPKYRCYHVSVKIRTENYTGHPQIAALADGRSLQHQNLPVQKTQDWTLTHAVFNSLEHEKVTLYFGIWGGGKGMLQWKEWKIEEAGLVNVLRRPGCPFTVEGCTEGKDYEPVADPRLGNDPWKGEYHAWHEPVVLRTKLPEGTKLRVSWYHPAIIYDGQVSACISEPKTLELLKDEARRVRELWGTPGYMMSHDEFRTMNQDEACVKRNLDAGALLADNARACVKLLEGSTVYVWNDMFDPFHNAVDKYYLVRGDLKGSWEGLEKDVVIVNWHFGAREKSLPFFADRGHRQVLAGYYDGPVDQVKEWLVSAAKVKGVIGVMYTTWRNDYSRLEDFAKACRD
ncbi:MAG TPA: hypothetical protein VEN81_02155 [Planctomycetota bacterium]|nr:hypothetical protein [Planctomycetota bacterium]